MKNHGVMVVGASIAEAWDDLYYLERAAEAQRLAADPKLEHAESAELRRVLATRWEGLLDLAEVG